MMKPIAAAMPGDAAVSDAVVETAITIAPNLVGLVSRPRKARAARVGIVLLNAGLVHRAGPFRGYVQLARVMAAAGFPVLRFDHSGLGDSPQAVAATASRASELRAAMAALASHSGVDQFVVGGICSAADDAFRFAADEDKIVGLLLLDGPAYRTPQFWLRHLLPRMFSPQKAWHFLRRRADHEAGIDDFRDFPAPADGRARVAAMVKRDMRLLYVFTGGAYSYFNHRGQLSACLGPAAKSGKVSLEFWPDCDHTFYLKRDRQRLHARVAEWMQSNFASRGNP